jgi:type II secretory pathway pseudopilin PulG
MKMLSRSKQLGVTIVELSIVLVVVAIVAFGVLRWGKSQIDESKANDESNNIRLVANKVKGYKSNKTNFATLTTAEAAQSGGIPEAMVNGTNINNTVGGSITLAPTTITNPNDAFIITSNNYSDAVCKGIPAKIDADSAAISINGTNVKAVGGQLNDAGTFAACAAGANSIAVTFTR